MDPKLRMIRHPGQTAPTPKTDLVVHAVAMDHFLNLLPHLMAKGLAWVRDLAVAAAVALVVVAVVMSHRLKHACLISGRDYTGRHGTERL